MISRSLRTICAVGVVSTLAFALKSINAKEDAKPEQQVVVVYPIADLPIWTTPPANNPDSEESKAQPAILIALIQASVDSQEWGENGGSISPHEEVTALVIRTTRANHREIANLLERLRIAERNRKKANEEQPLKISLSEPKIVVPPDPILNQLEQRPELWRRNQPGVALDMRILSGRLTKTTAPNSFLSK